MKKSEVAKIAATWWTSQLDKADIDVGDSISIAQIMVTVAQGHYREKIVNLCNEGTK